MLWAVNTSWMVWNAHVLGLLGGATLVLYDGSGTLTYSGGARRNAGASTPGRGAMAAIFSP